MVRLYLLFAIFFGVIGSVNGQFFKEGELSGITDIEIGKPFNAHVWQNELDYIGLTPDFAVYEYTGECCQSIYGANVDNIKIYYGDGHDPRRPQSTSNGKTVRMIEILFYSLDKPSIQDIIDDKILTEDELEVQAEFIGDMMEAISHDALRAGIWDESSPEWNQEELHYIWKFNNGDLFFEPGYYNDRRGFVPRILILSNED